MKNRKTKRYIAILISLSFIVFILILAISYLRNKIIEKNMPLMEDFYFLVYEGMEEPQCTIIYKYDVQRDETYEVGRVPGYFHNGEIDSKKEYIMGLRGSLMNEENPGAEFGVVRFSLKDGTSEILLTDEEMHTFEEGKIHWLLSYIGDDGEKVYIHYYGIEGISNIFISYDLRTGERKRVSVPKGKYKEILDINEYVVWGRDGSTIIRYDMKTGEVRKIVEGARRAYISDDETKLTFTRPGDYKHVYLYDMESREEKCILKAGWNILFGNYYQYAAGWDRSGEYYFYVERFPRMVGNDTRVKVYNLKTGKSRCVYREPKSHGGFEFVRNAGMEKIEE